jgi:hypothetical protein
VIVAVGVFALYLLGGGAFTRHAARYAWRGKGMNDIDGFDVFFAVVVCLCWLPLVAVYWIREGIRMSKKHNTKHRRSPSHYGDKVKGEGSVRMSDHRLSDGKMSSTKR